MEQITKVKKVCQNVTIYLSRELGGAAISARILFSGLNAAFDPLPPPKPTGLAGAVHERRLCARVPSLQIIEIRTIGETIKFVRELWGKNARRDVERPAMN
ncbi:hypothetical protein [Mesorhizobium sp. WSM3868]|uniref:hypothetical protein n=1 Tax=Mesorhizobium sp. WSM3868 TaxID=2029405 RepID=UPI00117C1EF9|nr:hypothetical protein [Mesorhizobium sp. WSM3868]